MKTYKLLSLHLSIPFITNPADILAYIVRQYLSIPSNIYESFIDYERTFAKRFVKFQHLPESLAENVKQDLLACINQIFRDASAEVITEIEYISHPGETMQTATNNKDFYNLSIDMKVVMNTKLYSISSSIEVDDNKILKINFQDEID